MTPPRRTLLVYRGVALALSFAWFYRAPTKLAAIRQLAGIDVEQTYFPRVFASAWTLGGCFAAVLLATLLTLASRRTAVLRAHAWICVAASWLLVIHMRTFAFQLGVTSLWASLWLAWFAQRLPDADDAPALDRAARLARVVIGVVFVGAAAGKWTHGYWSGDATFHMMFEQQQTWLFGRLRHDFDSQQLHAIGRAYAHLAVIGETTLALLWLLPSRVSLPGYVAGMAGLWAMTTPDVIEVLAPLMGVAIAGAWCARRAARVTAHRALDPDFDPNLESTAP